MLIWFYASLIQIVLFAEILSYNYKPLNSKTVSKRDFFQMYHQRPNLYPSKYGFTKLKDTNNNSLDNLFHNLIRNQRRVNKSKRFDEYSDDDYQNEAPIKKISYNKNLRDLDPYSIEDNRRASYNAYPKAPYLRRMEFIHRQVSTEKAPTTSKGRARSIKPIKNNFLQIQTQLFNKLLAKLDLNKCPQSGWGNTEPQELPTGFRPNPISTKPPIIPVCVKKGDTSEILSKLLSPEVYRARFCKDIRDSSKIKVHKKIKHLPKKNDDDSDPELSMHFEDESKTEDIREFISEAQMLNIVFAVVGVFVLGTLVFILDKCGCFSSLQRKLSSNHLSNSRCTNPKCIDKDTCTCNVCFKENFPSCNNLIDSLPQQSSNVINDIESKDSDKKDCVCNYLHSSSSKESNVSKNTSNQSLNQSIFDNDGSDHKCNCYDNRRDVEDRIKCLLRTAIKESSRGRIAAEAALINAASQIIKFQNKKLFEGDQLEKERRRIYCFIQKSIKDIKNLKKSDMWVEEMVIDQAIQNIMNTCSCNQIAPAKVNQFLTDLFQKSAKNFNTKTMATEAILEETVDEIIKRKIIRDCPADFCDPSTEGSPLEVRLRTYLKYQVATILCAEPHQLKNAIETLIHNILRNEIKEIDGKKIRQYPGNQLKMKDLDGDKRTNDNKRSVLFSSTQDMENLIKSKTLSGMDEVKPQFYNNQAMPLQIDNKRWLRLVATDPQDDDPKAKDINNLLADGFSSKYDYGGKKKYRK